MTDHLHGPAHFVALAEAKLKTAQDAESQARDAVAEIEQRIEETGSRLAKIKTDLQNGKLSDSEAGGLFAIAREDESDLIELRQAALAKLAEAAATRQQAENECNQAQVAIELYERQMSFDALSAHVAAIETTLTNAIAELFALGQAIGKPYQLSASWTPGEVLRRAVMLGVPPTVETGQ